MRTAGTSQSNDWFEEQRGRRDGCWARPRARRRAAGQRDDAAYGGELDAFTAPDLVDVCRSVYASGAREVVIDLTDTSFLDSSGLRALVGLQQLFGRDGGAVRLSQPSKPVMRVLEITGLTGYFSIDDARPT
jgi:anti-sigma B factor antagonist